MGNLTPPTEWGPLWWLVGVQFVLLSWVVSRYMVLLKDILEERAKSRAALVRVAEALRALRERVQ